MESIREAQKKYCSRALIISIFICCSCILINQVPAGKGILLGTLFSIINFFIIGETLPQRLGLSKKKTFLKAFSSIWLRYIILAIPVVAAIKSDQFNLFGVISGLFTIQIVILSEHLYLHVISIQRKRFN